MHIVGIDYGLSRVGVAVADEETAMALPFKTLQRSGKSDRQCVSMLLDALAEHEVTEFVVGLPLSLDGSEGASARMCRAFAERLSKRTRQKVTLWDERLTTLQAERSLGALGLSARQQKSVVDEAAAAIILSSYLEAAEHR